MPEQISGGMGFGAIRLNGQIVHFQGLHDVYSVNPIGASDTITVGDKASVRNLNPQFVDGVRLRDLFTESEIQAEAIEVLSMLSSEGVSYETTETVAFADTAAKG